FLIFYAFNVFISLFHCLFFKCFTTPSSLLKILSARSHNSSSIYGLVWTYVPRLRVLYLWCTFVVTQNKYLTVNVLTVLMRRTTVVTISVFLNTKRHYAN